jgi:type I restriction enzyme S subunit
VTNWKEYKLGELCTITSSKRIFYKEYVSEGVPFFRSKEIIEKANGNDISTELFITKDKFQEIKDKFGVPLAGDILLTSVGTLGVSYQVQESDYFYFKDGNLTWFKDFSDEINTKFLLYWLRSPLGKEGFNSITIGSTQAALTIAGLKGIKLSIPDLPTQTAIAEILSSLDDKIELNNKINQELENLAQTLFKQWFIDFEFPNEKGEPYKSSGGELVDSELGEIPKGWEVKPIGDLFEFVIGGDWGKDDIDDEHSEMNYVIRGTDILTLKSGSKNGVPYRAIKPSKLKNRQLEVNDIIIEISGGSKGQPTGRTVLITKEILERLDYNAIPASFCRLIRPKNDFAEFLGIYLTKIYDEGKTWEYQNQSTGISNFQFKFFESSEILALPSDLRIIDEFNSLISGFYNLMTTNENQELTLLRDTLLPKLISGELEVAEVMAEKA